MSLYPKILDWAKRQPLWQQDALRRLTESPELDERALAELMELCAAEDMSEAPSTPGLEPIPLNESHVPARIGTDQLIRLTELNHCFGVNALAADQKLPFAKAGLTVFYGNNGSGKSGYARVLRKLCKAQAKDTKIHPNVFKPDSVRLKVEVSYEVDQQPGSYVWENSGELDCEVLRHIGFFDGDCSDAYLKSATELTYIPSGAELFGQLAQICEQLKERVSGRLQQVLSQRPQLDFLEKQDELFQKLTTLLKEADFRELQNSLALTDEERGKHELLDQKLKQIAAKLQGGGMATLKTRIEKMGKVIEALQKIQDLVCTEGYGRLTKIVKTHRQNQEAATLASRKAFSGEPLSGVGEEVWQRLWEAARSFSTEVAYRDQKFPVVEDDSLCVLCCQPLSTTAGERMIRFENFVKDSTAETARKSAEELQKARKWLDSLAPGLENAIQSAAVSDFCPELSNKLGADLQWVESCVSSILDGLDKLDLPSIEFRSFQIDAASAQQKALKEELDTLQQLSSGDKSKQMQDEYRVLEQRTNALENWGTLVAYQKSLADEHRLQRVIKQLSTSNITRTASSLVKESVSDEISEAFDSYRKRLWGRDIPVSCEFAGGQRGVLRQDLVLTGSSSKLRAGDVISEGERKCAALAAFLTEARFHNETTPLILDDPVSSFDHLARERIASVLVDEASARQIIVFTHDIAFLFILTEKAESADVDLLSCSIDRAPSQPGICNEELPQIAQSFKARSGPLKQQIARIKSSREAMQDSEYAKKAYAVASSLRALWERGVEELLLNGAIKRFGREVQTQRLKVFSEKFEIQEFQVLEKEMTRLSCWTDAHDTGSNLNPATPTVEELETAFQELEDWAKRLKKKHN